MHNIISVSLITGYFLFLLVSGIIIFYVYKNRKSYGTELIAFIISVIIFNSGFIFSSFFMCSVVLFFSLEINLILWKISIVIGFISLTLTLVIYSFFREYKKIPLRPFILLSLLYGLLIGILIIPNSVIIEYASPIPSSFTIIAPSNIHYHFNIFTGLIIIILQSFISIYILYNALLLYLRTRKKERILPVLINSIIFLIPILMFFTYIIIQLTIFRELYIILLWITIFGLDIMLIKEPEMFFILPNEIYSINIFHKSGVLLYSYNFGNKFENDSAIWGNILIGLNHILSEFIDKTDKIDVIQTKNAEIVIKYENDYGYAVVVITNRKNSIIENLIEKFSLNFKNKYMRELNEIQDLNRIINISEFKDTKQIIEQNFEFYL
jgi:hypothetical protein